MIPTQLINPHYDVNATLVLKIEKNDYQANVDKTLKNYRQKANVPGFRPGNVPTSDRKSVV